MLDICRQIFREKFVEFIISRSVIVPFISNDLHQLQQAQPPLTTASFRVWGCVASGHRRDGRGAGRHGGGGRAVRWRRCPCHGRPRIDRVDGWHIKKTVVGKRKGGVSIPRELSEPDWRCGGGREGEKVVRGRCERRGIMMERDPSL